MANKAKAIEIKTEIKRLSAIFAEVDQSKQRIAEGLIEEAAFMRSTLKELKALVDADGPIDIMPQGDYSILREHPALRSYTTMIQRYSAVCKELSGLLPKDAPKIEDDGFDDFLSRKTK